MFNISVSFALVPSNAWKKELQTVTNDPKGREHWWPLLPITALPAAKARSSPLERDVLDL